MRSTKWKRKKERKRKSVNIKKYIGKLKKNNNYDLKLKKKKNEISKITKEKVEKNLKEVTVLFGMTSQ